jgi:hypothetical protein
MPAIKFDSSLSWSTILSIVIAIVSVAGFFFGLKSNQKVQMAQYQALKADLDDVKSQLGELRRLHLAVSNTVEVQGKSISTVAKVAEDNKKQLKVNTAVIPKLVSHVEELKKQVEIQIPK